MLATPTQVHSSGPISTIVSPSWRDVGSARFPRGLPARRVVVRVRVARPKGSRLRLELVSPDGGVWRLRFPERVAVGNGARGCRGSALRFDTAGASGGTRFLLGWRSSRGRWRLRATGRGVVACWQLWVTRARPDTMHARAGGTAATLESIALGGATAYHVVIHRLGRPMRLPRLVCELCVEQPAIGVRDVDGDRDPEVFAEFSLGGAHCCLVSVIYRHAAPARYSSTVTVWPGEGVGYRLRDLDRDGRLEFVSASDFECAFVACAGSVFPLRIWDFRGGTFVDVTGSYPRLVAAEARRYWRTFRDSARQNHPLRNFLASWAADEFALGRGESAMRWISYHQPRWYLRDLRCLLAEWGYDGSGRCPAVMCGRLTTDPSPT